MEDLNQLIPRNYLFGSCMQSGRTVEDAYEAFQKKKVETNENYQDLKTKIELDLRSRRSYELCNT